MPDSLFGLTPLSGTIPWGQYLFRIEPVHRGDVVVFVFPPDPTKDFIKRVIGFRGDTVEVKDGKGLFAMGASRRTACAFRAQPPESASRNRAARLFRADHGSPGQFLMMGDNRDRSYDSRFWGFVDRNEVEGRAMFIYWSWDSDSKAYIPIRWDRFGRIIH